MEYDHRRRFNGRISGPFHGCYKLKVICFLFDPRVGGPHVCARGIYQRFIELGHDARIALPLGDGNAQSFFEDSGVPLDQLKIFKPASPKNITGFLRYIFGLPISIFRTVTYLKDQSPDVIRVNGALDLVPVISGWISGTPVILYLNDTVFSARLSRLLVKIAKPFVSRLVAAASRVALHHGVSETTIIFEPVDTKKYQPREIDGFSSKKPMLGLLANWNPVKCQERFIEAIQLLQEDGLATYGRILGGFPETQEAYWAPLLDQIEELGLADFIEARGFVDDTAAALAELDILLLTSRSEACPVCVLEAMATGVPVVAFDVGGVTEMLGAETDDPAGVVVPEGDTAAMVVEVRKLLNDKKSYDEKSLAGPKRTEKLFSLETCVQRHEALCLELTAERQRD